MSRKIALACVLALVMGFATAALANNAPGDKATGGVSWVSAGGASLHTTFQAYAEGPGTGDRGNLNQRLIPSETSDGARVWVDIRCVEVDGNQAWMAGEIVRAQGTWTSRVGRWQVTHVIDNGSLPSPDKIGNTTLALAEGEAEACGLVASHGFTAGGTVTDGNLVVHH